ncbi:hypothetical protein EMCRGX_G012575 [Ephydatia muelleri]
MRMHVYMHLAFKELKLQCDLSLNHFYMQFNDVNLKLIPKKKNIYIYGLALLDVFFAKQELGEALLFSSLKSTKPALCQEKVERIIEIMKKQFPTESLDLQVFTHKANQKCRDASRHYAPASTK